MQKTKPKIPQNEEVYFIFEKNSYYNSVDLFIKHTEEVRQENLFLIFQSYIKNRENLLTHIYIIALDNHTQEEKNISIFHHIKIEKINKMSLFDFTDWYESIYEQDYEYIRSMKYYGFRFIFSKESIIWKNGTIYPKYPWDTNFREVIVENKKYTNKIIMLEKEITNLKKEIENYTKNKK